MKKISPTKFLVASFSFLTLSPITGSAAEKLTALIVDGQNNHKWEESTPLLEAILESSERFVVDVATSPAKGADMSGFVPKWADYDVIVSNYSGDLWPEAARESFEAYVGSGGGFVSVHAADNSFPGWAEYNKMIGVGGWGGRDERSGPMLRIRDGGLARVSSPGKGGGHGKRHDFVVESVGQHPITSGLPRQWKHADDELYDKLRGPAVNVTVIASAFSDPATGGTGENEPILMTVDYQKGRVFHTTLGHHAPSFESIGFQETLKRGTEWAATGKVTFDPVPAKVLSVDVVGKAPIKVAAPPAAEEKSEKTKEAPKFVGKPQVKKVAPAFAAVGSGGGEKKVESAEAENEPNSAEPKNAEGGKWISLFDGKTLKGWKQLNGTASYRVANGAIIGRTAEGSPNSFLCTEKEFGDFELQFDVWVDTGLNSGFQIRSREKTAEDIAAEIEAAGGEKQKKHTELGRFFGPQVEIEHSPGQAAFIYGEATGFGWLSPEPGNKDEKKSTHSHMTNDAWNHFRIVAKGSRIQTWINGQAVADLTHEEIYKSHPKGKFGLQVHSIKSGSGPFTVRWRNVKLKEL